MHEAEFASDVEAMKKSLEDIRHGKGIPIEMAFTEGCQKLLKLKASGKMRLDQPQTKQAHLT